MMLHMKCWLFVNLFLYLRSNMAIGQSENITVPIALTKAINNPINK